MLRCDGNTVIGLTAVLGLALLTDVQTRFGGSLLAAAFGAGVKLTTVLGVTLLADVRDRPDRPEPTATLAARKEVIPLPLHVRHAQFGLQQPIGTLDEAVIGCLGPGLLGNFGLDAGDIALFQGEEWVLQRRQRRLYSQGFLLCPGSLPGLADGEWHCVRRERLDSRAAQSGFDPDGYRFSAAWSERVRFRLCTTGPQVVRHQLLNAAHGPSDC